MTYFEKTYLKKKSNSISIKESKKIQKLLSAKALSGVDSKKISTADLKRITKLKPAPAASFSIESYIRPFDEA
jgi:hypothetical protein